MEELKKQIAEKFGLDAEKADGAIQMVLNFVKDKLPDNMKGLVDSALKGECGGIMDQAKGMLGGLFK